MKKNYRFTFFRHILIPFFLIAILGSVFTGNFFSIILVDNAPAVQLARKTGKSDSLEIQALLRTEAMIRRQAKSEAKLVVSYDLERENSRPEGRVTIGGSRRNMLISSSCWVILVFFLYLWLRPLLQFLHKGQDDKRDRAVYIYENFYKGLFLYALIDECLNFFLFYDFYDTTKLLTLILPLMTMKILVFCYFLYLYMEPVLFIHVSKSMYSEEVIFKFKNKKSLYIYTKLVLMLVVLIILPLTMILVSIKKGYFLLEHYQNNVSALIVVTIILLIGNMQILYKSIQEPLVRLGNKMTALAAGNFNDYSTVLSNDEVGVLKANFNIMVDQLREREEIRETFGKYVSVEIAKKLLDEKKINLGGENIEATVLFSDIRNFTTMSEQMTPEAVVRFLNSYFSFITGPIMKNNGVINKFIGDAVMAIFTPNLGSLYHVDDAVKAVLEMREKLKEFNQSGNMGSEIRFGIGLNTGVLVAGNIGTDKRVEYTVIGDTVNIAARLESETKNHDCDIIISETVYDKLSEPLKAGLNFAKISELILKGKENPVIAYKIQSG